MKTKGWLIALCLAVSLSGCGRIYYVESLRGWVDNGRYTTQISKGIGCKYRILVPQSDNDYEVHFICTKDFYTNGYTFDSFGSIPQDDTIYRIMVVKKPPIPLWVFKETYFSKMVDIGARGFDRDMIKIHEEPFLFGANPAIYEVYTQRAPSVYYYISRFQPNDKILTHAVYYVDYCNYYIIFWIQASNQSGKNAVNERNRWRVVNRTWQPANRFVRSFVLTK